MTESERKDSKKMGRKNTNKRRQKVLHCIEYSKQMFLEVKLHGLVPHFCIHVSVKDLYVYSNDWSACFAVLRFAADRGNININRSQIHECRNWERCSDPSSFACFTGDNPPPPLISPSQNPPSRLLGLFDYYNET